MASSDSVTARGALTPSAAARVAADTFGCAPKAAIGARPRRSGCAAWRGPGSSTADDVARLDGARAGGRARQDDVARLERHEAREVGHDQPEREEQRVGRRLLGELVVHEHAQPERLDVDVARLDAGADRRVAVLALRPQVRPEIAPAQVVQADVVRRRVPADVRETVLRRDAACRAADHERDLALERQQLGALRPGDGIAVRRQRGGRLEEVGRHRGRPSPLRRAAA